jgi:ElaB/YqjD/DUF883 family membrane-anchored ribosome-binding protein
MKPDQATSPDALLTELQEVIDKGEKALDATADMKSTDATSLRTRVQARVLEARADLTRLQDLTVEKAKAAGRVTDEYVHENPWRAVGLGAAVGLLIGVLATRR